MNENFTPAASSVRPHRPHGARLQVRGRVHVVRAKTGSVLRPLQPVAILRPQFSVL
jgi:hypothetical protein